MKKIINGRKYDTDTAKKIGSYYNGLSCTDFSYLSETLYQKRTNEFFVHGKGGALSRYGLRCGRGMTDGEAIVPLSESAAKEWVEEHSCVEVYEELFGKVDE